MPAKAPPQNQRHAREAGAALATTAPIAARWVERVLASHEPPVTVAQYLALRAMASGPISAAPLARRTGVSGAAVSQLISALQAKGLVERGGPLDDPRSRSISLTEQGGQTLASATELVSGRLGELLVDLPKPEADALVRLLERVEAALSGTAPPKRPAPPRPPRPPRRP
jgi:DNA-binding MarR family transcriptional regulator